MDSAAAERLADVEETIQQFIRTNLVEDFTGEDPLAEMTFDSLALEQLIDHLEEKYQILLDGTDFARWNFISVPVAAAMFERRRQQAEHAREPDRPG